MKELWKAREKQTNKKPHPNNSFIILFFLGC